MFPTIICGCKCDLEEERELSAKELKEFAEKNLFEKGANLSKYNSTMPFFIETSAKKNINVSEVFQSVIKQVIDKRNIEKGLKPKKSEKSRFFSSVSESSGKDDINDFKDKIKK